MLAAGSNVCESADASRNRWRRYAAQLRAAAVLHAAGILLIGVQKMLLRMRRRPFAVRRELVRPHWLDGGPFIVGDFVTLDSSLPVRKVEAGRATDLNTTCISFAVRHPAVPECVGPDHHVP
jgi:hypothetical protein